MSFITADFETYYGNGLGFKTQTNEEYLRDPRFHVIGVAVKVDDEPSQWFSGTMEETKHWLQQFDWKNSCLLAHNTLFDGSILAWHFGIIPAFYYDTLSMARAIHGVEVGNSLAKLAEYYSIGTKGDEIVNAYNKARTDFSKEDLKRYGAYCRNDVELCYKLFQILNEIRPIGEVNVMEQFKYLAACGRATEFPESEHELIDMTLRMYICPTLRVDDAMLVTRLDDIQKEKQELLSTLMGALGVTTEEAVRKVLASNPKFAALLTDMGVEVPMKVSARTGKVAPAFAKNDEGFLALQEHENPVVQQLCAIRLATKSTMEEKRIERFIGIGGRNRGFLPIPLKYYAAHTGRWGGDDKINMQNLPTRDKLKKTLKNSVVPPPGYVVINSDSSQIEARILAWLAGQNDVVEWFRQKRDVYCEDASKVYGRTITKADPVERFVGKTMRLGLGFGTGPDKLQHTLKTSPPGADLPIETCKEFVYTWRNENSFITGFWQETEQHMQNFLAWPEGKKAYWAGKVEGVVEVTPEGFRLPNGLYMRYPNLWTEYDSKGRRQYMYTSRKGPQKTWGGSITENLIQALARIVVGEQMIKINRVYPVVLTVHDAAVIVVPERERVAAMQFVTEIMSAPPVWGPTLPVACEASWGYSYGECRTDEQWEQLNREERSNEDSLRMAS